MADVTMLTEAIREITARQRLDGVLIRVRKLARIFIVNISVFNVSNVKISAISLCLTSTLALAQLPNQTQTQAQTRQKLLQDLDSGQIQDAILLGQEAVSHWPRDAQLRHYLGVAYFK